VALTPLRAAESIGSMARETFGEFSRHRSQWLAAAIAYFTTFAIAPLIVIVVEIAGAVLGSHRTVLAAIYGYVDANGGPDASRLVRSIVAATFSQRRSGSFAQIATWAIFVASAFGWCGALQEALNTVWDVPQAKRPLIETLKARAIPFAMMLGIAVLLLLSVFANSAIAVANGVLARAFPGLPFLANLLDVVAALVLTTALFALLFEGVPERRVSWRHVWPGALVSALLFVAGQFVLARYLARMGTSSSFGAFAGLAVFLIWIYYSAQIVLLGAEFTRVYARRVEGGGEALPSPVESRS
jgi:membrane protein